MITLDDVRTRATLTVPEAGELLGVGRSVAYEAAQRGELPTLKLGRRLLVPVPKLLELIGLPPDDSEPDPSTESGTATIHVLATRNGERQHAPDTST